MVRHTRTHGRDQRRQHHLPASELHRVTESALYLLRTSPEWVHRRVETIEVIDERVVRRRLSVDFTVPTDLASPPPKVRDDVRAALVTRISGTRQTTAFVPITWLKRYRREPRLPAGRMHFDVTDESGKSIPLLGASELDRITASMLYRLAEIELAKHGLKPDRAVRDALLHVAISFPPSIALLKALLDDRSEDWRDFGGDRQGLRRRALMLEPMFVDLLCLAARHRLVLVPVIGKPGERRIIKLAYDEPSAPAPVAWWKSLTQRTGWWPMIVAVPMPVIGAARYQHVQVVSPPNVEMTGAQLRGTRPRDAESAAIFARAGPDRDDDYACAVDGPANRAHLYIDNAHEHQVGVLKLGFRAERRGLVTASLAAATLIAVVLMTFAVWPERLVGRANNSTSLLLIGPGLIAALLTRGGEHAMARLLFRFPRLMLATAAIVVVAAAVWVAALAPDTTQTVEMSIQQGQPRWETTTHVAAPGWELTTALWALAGTSAVLWIGMWLSWWFPRPRRHSGGSVASRAAEGGGPT